MELEGLKRGLQHLTSLGHSIKALVTDQHMQIQKYMRETYATILHYYDVWHVAKGSSIHSFRVIKNETMKFVTVSIQELFHRLHHYATSAICHQNA